MLGRELRTAMNCEFPLPRQAAPRFPSNHAREVPCHGHSRLSCRRTGRACASACSAAPSIRPRRASRRLSAGDETARPRSGLVAGDARQSAQGHARPRSARRARRRRAGAGASSAHRRHRSRSATRHPLHLSRRSPICRQRCPGVRFVWIMGADNLRSFHRWQRWRGIAALVPIAVVDRLGPSLYATAGIAGQALGLCASARNRRRGRCRNARPPAWVYLHGLKSPLSSTALRAARALQSG